MRGKIERLQKILDESRYTVAICGSGMMEEGGFVGVKHPERAYEIEEKYGDSPEEIFSSVYYNTRPEQFFRFYKEEMLKIAPEPTASGEIMAAMERAGRLHCIITANIYDHPRKAGCSNVINLHGTIYDNKCPRCGREYSLDYVMNSRKVPICEKCNVPVRPMVSLFGEMVDARLLARAVDEIEKADTLLLLGTNLDSEVFSSYFRYFEGSSLVVIHQREHYMDSKADLVIIDQPKNVLPQLRF